MLPGHIWMSWHCENPDAPMYTTTDSKTKSSIKAFWDSQEPAVIPPSERPRDKDPEHKQRLYPLHPLHQSHHVAMRKRRIVVVPSMSRLPDRTKLEDNPEMQSDYARGTLVLFKPFRSMDDLKQEDQSKFIS
jgi:hypothetical protein